jgi:hypothetical protein
LLLYLLTLPSRNTSDRPKAVSNKKYTTKKGESQDKKGGNNKNIEIFREEGMGVVYNFFLIKKTPPYGFQNYHAFSFSIPSFSTH